LRVVLCLFGILFLGVADNQVISPLLPAIRAQFGKTAQEMGFLFTGYAVMAGLSALIWGPLSDAFGSKKGLLAGLLVLSLGSAVSFSSRTFLLLLIGRIITGMGASLLSLNTISYAADFFPYATRGWAMGSIFSSYFAALILGVPIGSLVADYLGWNAVFAMAGTTALFLLVSVRWALPDSAGRGRSRDIAFSIADQLRAYPGFLRASKTLGALVSSFFASAGTTGFIAFVGVWLHDSFGVTGKQIGLVFLASGAAALIVSPFAGSLSDRIGKRIQFIASNLSMAILLLVVPDLRWGVVLFIVFGLISLSAAFRQGPMEALVTEVVSPTSRGTFVALKNSFSQLGIAVAALLSGILFEWKGYAAICILCATLNVMAAAVMVLLVRDRSL
jgi:predicted MFS family arabinose efflux permease